MTHETTKPLDDMTEPDLAAIFRRVAERVQWSLPPNTGFIVLAAPQGEGGIAQYVSNVRRDDAAKWMRETIARWEAGDFVPRVDE